jgi:hypothetical protein
VWLLVLISSIVFAALLGSGCDRSIAQPTPEAGDTNNTEGVPAELGVLLELRSDQEAVVAGCFAVSRAALSASDTNRFPGFCLTQIAEARSLLLEKDFGASPTRSQRDLRGHILFAFSWHLAARNYV